jgi:hypothetical protein
MTTDRRPPTHAERCRALVAEARTATLATVARDPAGFPFGSLVTIAADREGRPLLLLSRLAEHTQNLDADERASILVAEPAADGTVPLALGRVTLLGPCRPVPASERDDARTARETRTRRPMSTSRISRSTGSSRQPYVMSEASGGCRG